MFFEGTPFWLVLKTKGKPPFWGVPQKRHTCDREEVCDIMEELLPLMLTFFLTEPGRGHGAQNASVVRTALVDLLQMLVDCTLL